MIETEFEFEPHAGNAMVGVIWSGTSKYVTMLCYDDYGDSPAMLTPTMAREVAARLVELADEVDR